MPKQTCIPLAFRRAVGRLQIEAAKPHPALRLGPAQWVRALRASLHMTQAQLARRVGLSQAHIGLIELGRVAPQISTLEAVFDGLFCDLVVLPVPRRRVAEIIAERTTGIPNARMWDEPPGPWA